MDTTFTCAHCGGTFDSDWTREDAEREREQVFQSPRKQTDAVVCDDCYLMMIRARPPKNWVGAA